MDLITPTPFEAVRALGSICESVNCGRLDKDLLLSQYFPAFVGFLFFVPVVVVLISLLARKKSESDFLKPQTSYHNISILLLLSLTIAAAAFIFFYYI